MINFEQFSQNRRASIRVVELQGRKRTVGGGYIPRKILVTGLPLATQTGITAGNIEKCVNADAVAVKYGYGSELHRQALRVFAALGGFYENAYFCPLSLADGASAATGNIAFVGSATSSGTHFFTIGGNTYQLNARLGQTAKEQAEALAALITKDINSAITAEYQLSETVDTVILTAKNKSVTGNEMRILYNYLPSQQQGAPNGVTVTLSGEYLTGGTGTPDVSELFVKDGRDNLGDTWYTEITCPYTDTGALAIYKDALENRVKPGTDRMAGSFVAFTKLNYTEALAKSETINARFIGAGWEPNSITPAYEFSAAQLGNIAYYAMLDPGRPNMDTELPVEVIPAGNMTYAENDALYKSGMTYYKQDASGKLLCGDVSLTYRVTPQGAATEEWFDYVSLTRIQQKVFDTLTTFKSDPFIRPIAVDNNSISKKSYAIRPITVIAYMRALVDYWAEQGWTKNPDEVKSTITAEINAAYNGRIDAELTDDPAEALRIIAIKYAYLY